MKTPRLDMMSFLKSLKSKKRIKLSKPKSQLKSKFELVRLNLN